MVTKTFHVIVNALKNIRIQIIGYPMIRSPFRTLIEIGLVENIQTDIELHQPGGITFQYLAKKTMLFEMKCPQKGIESTFTDLNVYRPLFFICAFYN